MPQKLRVEGIMAWQPKPPKKMLRSESHGHSASVKIQVLTDTYLCCVPAELLAERQRSRILSVSAPDLDNVLKVFRLQ